MKQRNAKKKDNNKGNYFIQMTAILFHWHWGMDDEKCNCHTLFVSVYILTCHANETPCS